MDLSMVHLNGLVLIKLGFSASTLFVSNLNPLFSDVSNREDRTLIGYFFNLFY